MVKDNYIDIIQAKLTQKRFFHSVCVAEEAKRLAEKYGADPNKAYLAGVLHDIMKDSSQNEQLQILDRFDIILDNVEAETPKLWHAKSGAVYIEKNLGLKDEDILNAIRYHTTARADMSLLEKILYVADFTSSDRVYKGVEAIRIIADENLEKAVLEGLAFTIFDLSNRKMPIHKNTFEAYNKSILLNK